MNLKELYEESKGIVNKCRKEYHLHLWEKEDWNQEGMMCLYELLKNYKASQVKEKQEQLERLMGGECFKGRKALLGELRVVLSDFR